MNPLTDNLKTWFRLYTNLLPGTLTYRTHSREVANLHVLWLAFVAQNVESFVWILAHLEFFALILTSANNFVWYSSGLYSKEPWMSERAVVLCEE